MTCDVVRAVLFLFWLQSVSSGQSTKWADYQCSLMLFSGTDFHGQVWQWQSHQVRPKLPAAFVPKSSRTLGPCWWRTCGKSPRGSDKFRCRLLPPGSEFRKWPGSSALASVQKLVNRPLDKTDLVPEETGSAWKMAEGESETEAVASPLVAAASISNKPQSFEINLDPTDLLKQPDTRTTTTSHPEASSQISPGINIPNPDLKSEQPDPSLNVTTSANGINPDLTAETSSSAFIPEYNTEKDPFETLNPGIELLPEPDSPTSRPLTTTADQILTETSSEFHPTLIEPEEPVASNPEFGQDLDPVIILATTFLPEQTLHEEDLATESGSSTASSTMPTTWTTSPSSPASSISSSSCPPEPATTPIPTITSAPSTTASTRSTTWETSAATSFTATTIRADLDKKEAADTKKQVPREQKQRKGYQGWRYKLQQIIHKRIKNTRKASVALPLQFEQPTFETNSVFDTPSSKTSLAQGSTDQVIIPHTQQASSMVQKRVLSSDFTGETSSQDSRDAMTKVKGFQEKNFELLASKDIALEVTENNFREKSLAEQIHHEVTSQRIHLLEPQWLSSPQLTTEEMHSQSYQGKPLLQPTSPASTDITTQSISLQDVPESFHKEKGQSTKSLVILENDHGSIEIEHTLEGVDKASSLQTVSESFNLESSQRLWTSQETSSPQTSSFVTAPGTSMEVSLSSAEYVPIEVSTDHQMIATNNQMIDFILATSTSLPTLSSSTDQSEDSEPLSIAPFSSTSWQTSFKSHSDDFEPGSATQSWIQKACQSSEGSVNMCWAFGILTLVVIALTGVLAVIVLLIQYFYHYSPRVYIQVSSPAGPMGGVQTDPDDTLQELIS